VWSGVSKPTVAVSQNHLAPVFEIIQAPSVCENGYACLYVV